MSGTIDLNPNHFATVERILAEHVPGCEVRAYGSRATWTAKDYSDLDLAIVSDGPLNRRTLGRLKEAFEESTLPMRVDVLDWHATSESFREVIQRDYLVVQKGVGPHKVDKSSRWRTLSWGDLATLEYGKSLRGYESLRGPYRVYGTNGPIGWHSEALCPYPSVIIGRKGAYRGVHYSSNPFFVIDTAFYLRPKVEIDTLWAYYELLTQDINGMDSGSAIPSTSRNDFYGLPVQVPPLPEQRAIAHILGTLDDKIELNRRMNETLEEMARALFKSWFVDFEPVRAKMDGRWRRGESLPGLPAEHYDLFPDRLVPSELGEIPEGWEVKALDSFGQIVTGKTPSTREPAYFGNDVPFLRIPDMHGNMYALQTQKMLSTLGADSQPRKTLPPGSVSVSCIGTPGLVVLNHHHTQTNQQINTIVPQDERTSRYLYWACRNLSRDIETGGSGGSVLGNMNKSSFSALQILGAESVIICAFDEFTVPLHAKILSNKRESSTLAAQRDALLPKLVSGEIRVGRDVILTG